MKTCSMILIGLAAALSAPADTISNAPLTNTPVPAVATNAAAAVSAPAPATNIIASAVVDEPDVPVTNAVRLNFHDVPLGTIITYLSKRMGFVFSSDVELRGNTTIVSEQPIGADEVLQLLSTALAKNDYAMTTNGRILNITPVSAAHTSAATPVLEITSPTNLPMSDEIATVVLPVHTLVPAQLLKDLADVIPPGTTADANEAGNAIVMTGRKKDIRHFDEIISALDSSSISDVKVFVLHYADAKAVADELKEVYQSPDSQVARSDSRQRFRGFGGGGFPFGGGGGGDNNNTDQKNAANKAVFTSDDQMNAVIAAAPSDYFITITNIISELDQPNQEITVMRVFPLKHADAQETADELSNMFPDPTKNNDQSSRSPGFRFMPPWMQQQPAANNQSARMKLQTEVRAVPDMRTASVIVTASRETMEQIAGVIEALDRDPAGVQNAYAFSLDNADPATVSTVVQALFQSQSSRSSQQNNTSALEQRQTSAAQQQSTTTTGFGTSGGGGASALH